MFFISMGPILAVPKKVFREYIPLQDQFGSDLEFFISKRDLEHDLETGDFDVKIYFDGRSLLREKTYPQNIKVEIFTTDASGEKQLATILNRTVKNEKAAKNVLLATLLPRIEEDTTLIFDLYDSQNILTARYQEAIVVTNMDPVKIASLASIPDYTCDYGDGQCLMEYLLNNISFSANYDKHLKTEVVKNDKGRYFVNIPIKRGRRLGKKVRKLKIKGGGDSGTSTANFLSGYPVFENGDEKGRLIWNPDKSSFELGFSQSANEFNFLEQGGLQINTDLDFGYLNLGAGTASKAPLVFEVGSLLSTPVEGALEYDGTNLYFTDSTGRSTIGAEGPPGPAGPTGPAGPPGSPSATAIDLSNGGTLNGHVSFGGNGRVFDAVINGSLVYSDGSETNGYVLTTDSNGLATWVSAASLSGTGDDLGNHTATDNLDLASHHILNADNVNGVTGNFTNLGLGLTGPPSYNLHVNGTAIIGDASASLTAIGDMAGDSNTGVYVVGLGDNAARDNSGSDISALGRNAGRDNNGDDLVAVGQNSGYWNKGDFNTFAGRGSGVSSNGDYISGFGYYAGRENIASNVVGVGHAAARYNQGDYLIALGRSSGYQNIGIDVIALGQRSARQNNGNNLIALGFYAGENNKGDDNISIGYRAGNGGLLGNGNILIGKDVEAVDNNDHFQLNIGDTIYGDLANGEIALGAAKNNPEATLDVTGSFRYQDTNEADGFVLTSNASGMATWADISTLASNGDNLGNHTATQNLDLATYHIFNATRIVVNGYSLLGNSTNDVTAIGQNGALSNTGQFVEAIGYNAARNNTGDNIIAIGQNAAQGNSGTDDVIAIGASAGRYNRQIDLIAIGDGAGNLNKKLNVIAIGNRAGFDNNGQYAVEIGNEAGYQSNGDYLVAIGANAGRLQNGDYATIIGGGAGYDNSGDDVVLIGRESGNNNIGTGIVAIGRDTLKLNNGDYNIAIGNMTGSDLNNGSRNILLGDNVEVLNNNGDDQLNIGDTIYGDLAAGEIALGAAKDPEATLDVTGSFRYIDGGQAAGLVLTSNASGMAYWGVNESASGVAGAIQFSNGSGGFMDNGSDLFWDDTNRRLGVNVDDPAASLEVNGSLQFNEVIYYDEINVNTPAAAAVTIDWNDGNRQEVTLTDATTTMSFTDPPGSANLSLFVIQDGAGSRTVTWPAAINWPNGIPPTLTTVGGQIDIITCMYRQTAGTYYCQASLNFAP